MTSEAKQIFTRRLSQCNRGELVVIMYDILFTHLDEARNAHEQKDAAEFAENLRLANQVVDRLIQALDFKYDISKQLYSLYVFCREELAKAMYENRLERVENAERILRRLYQSFCQVAKADTSASMMKNTQQVYAGMTYGPSSINENLMDVNSQRGFFA